MVRITAPCCLSHHLLPKHCARGIVSPNPSFERTAEGGRSISTLGAFSPRHASYGDANMNVERIWAADVYRDGGSYGFCFDSDDGHWYEFFLQTRAFEEPQPQESHYPPVIYLESVNDKKPVQQLTWEEAKAFIAPLRYEGQRFQELVAVVNREGKRG